MATTEVPAPTAEDKARYDAAKDEVLKALAKKREADKKLVSALIIAAILRWLNDSCPGAD